MVHMGNAVHVHLSHKNFSVLCTRGSVAVLLSLSWTAKQQCVFYGPVQSGVGKHK